MHDWPTYWPITVQSLGSGERGERVAAVVRGDQFAYVGEQGAVLEAAGCRGGEAAFGEPFAVGAAGRNMWRAGSPARPRRPRPPETSVLAGAGAGGGIR